MAAEVMRQSGADRIDPSIRSSTNPLPHAIAKIPIGVPLPPSLKIDQDGATRADGGISPLAFPKEGEGLGVRMPTHRSSAGHRTVFIPGGELLIMMTSLKMSWTSCRVVSFSPPNGEKDGMRGSYPSVLLCFHPRW
jgi:hypothetical protein